MTQSTVTAMLTAVDLCCGAGGWIEAARGLPIRFLAAVDWENDCCSTVRYNHPGVPAVNADVTRLPLRLAPGGIDVFLGAIPCEEVSKAWKMVGQAVQIDTARAILTGICREAALLRGGGMISRGGGMRDMEES